MIRYKLKEIFVREDESFDMPSDAKVIRVNDGVSNTYFVTYIYPVNEEVKT
jgi:hypothetical protein